MMVEPSKRRTAFVLMLFNLEMKFYVRDYAVHAYPCLHLPKIVTLYSSRFQNMLLQPTHKASTVSSRLMRWWYFPLRRKNKRFLADVILQVWSVKPLIV